MKAKQHQTRLAVPRPAIGAQVLRLVLLFPLTLSWAQIQNLQKGESVCEGTSCEIESNSAVSTRFEGSQSDPTMTGNGQSANFSHEHEPNRGLQQSPKPAKKNSRSSPGTPAENEFQRFIYRSTGSHLPLYGWNLFEEDSAAFASSNSVPIPPDYVLGIGDNLVVRIAGQITIKAGVTVDRNGQIFIPRVGTVSVAGVRFRELQPLLSAQVSRFFRNFDLSVNLSRMRGLHVFVVGMAKRPGSHTVSASSTLINALFASGGPAPNGSLRKIELRRSGQIISELDLYDFLASGDTSHDVQLLNGDVIYIPPANGFVALTGSVQQVAVYELRGQSTVKDGLALAGGLTPTANGHRVVLEGIGDDRIRHIEQFDLDEAGLAKPLRSGDLLRVFPISPRFKNVVILRGNVERPGRYPWREGMHISDLLRSPETIIRTRYWRNRGWLGSDRGGWLAENDGPGNAKPRPLGPEQDNDSPRFGTEEIQGNTGAGESGRTKSRTAIRRSAAEINWDYAVIERLNHADLSTQLLPFNLGQAILHPASGDNLSLEPDDVVTIFSQRDLAVPVDKRTKFVWIEGEVNAAGVYRVGPGETLREVFARAGGLTSQAYLFAAELRRESTRIEQQNNLERMLDQMERDLPVKASRLAGSVNPEDKQASKEELESERAAIARLRQTHPTGRIVLGLQPSDSDAAALPSLPLEDGDRITIPARSATVAVAGAVYNQNSFLYRPGNSVKDYLRQSGGPTREADSRRLFVVRADGSVISKQMQHSFWGGSLESSKLMPGDTIVVPDKIRTGGLLRGLRDWSQVFSQFALGAAAIKVISP